MSSSTQPARAVINFSGSGDNTLVTAAAGKYIQVVQLFLVVGGATNLTFKDGQNSLSGPLPMLANGSIVLDASVVPWFLTTDVVNNLILNSSNAVQVSGAVYYTQV